MSGAAFRCMLQQTGMLAGITYLYGRIVPFPGNYVADLFSALIGNVPLPTALLKADPQMGDQDWLLLTYAVGGGGSLLVIGSASGIVTMSKVPGLTMARYTPHVLLAYTLGHGGVMLMGYWSP